jgi:hypothetical protein
MWVGDGSSSDNVLSLRNTNGAVLLSAGDGRLFVTSTGNVGIGTTAPAGTVHVLGGGSTPRFILQKSASGANNVISFLDETAATKAMLGLAEAANGVIAGSMLNDLSIRTETQKILFSTNAGSNAHLVIDTSGNVGIGTTSPTAKLHVVGNFTATGTKAALVETNSFGKRQLYAIESPENWFEDFGNAKLIDGQAVIQLDPVFAETVNTKEEYHVFLTPKGDCEGLYVANQTPTFFEVKELKKGKSNIAFDYRLVAKRKGYEKARLAKVEEISQEIQVAEVGK